MKNKNKQVFLSQPLIPYVIYAFQSGSFESIKLTVMGHFSLQQIVEAKT